MWVEREESQLREAWERNPRAEPGYDDMFVRDDAATERLRPLAASRGADERPHPEVTVDVQSWGAENDSDMWWDRVMPSPSGLLRHASRAGRRSAC